MVGADVPDLARDQQGAPGAPPFELVSVVIPVRDGGLLLSEQLDALAGQSYAGAWEVIIADNGSRDSTREFVLRWVDRIPSLRVIDASSKRGSPYARNLGAGVARGDLLLFCDADDIVYPNWIEQMVAAARDCDAVGGCMDEESLNDQITRAWRPPRANGGLPISVDFLPYTQNANSAVRTSVFRALGGLNERYHHGGDDIEFFWRLQLASYRLCYAPGAVVKYRHRRNLRRMARQSYDFGRAAAQLYRDFASAGVQPSGLRAGVRAWKQLLRSAPRSLASPEDRGNWIRVVAYRCGRIAGSLQYRVLYV